MKKVLSLVLCLVLSVAAVAAYAEAAETAEATGEPSRGVWDGNVYTNEYAGLIVEMPEGWVQYNDEQLASLMGISMDALSEAGVPVSKEMIEMNAIYDALVADAQTGNSVSILFENLTLLSAVMTEDIYFETLKMQLAQAMPTLECGDPGETQLGETAFQMMAATDAESGMEQRYLLRKQGNYMTIVTVTVMNGAVDEVMAIFQ